MSLEDQKTPRASLQAVKMAVDKAEQNNYKSSADDPNEVSAKLYDVLHSLRAGEVPGAKTYGPLDQQIAGVKALGDQLQEARSLPNKLATARHILEERKAHGESLGFDPNDNLPTHARTREPLTPGQITQFAAHPRLDLFVDSNSPHPMEKFGCTVCHAGQGSRHFDFVLAAHTPDNAAQHKTMGERKYHWDASHDWESPCCQTDSWNRACVKCHHRK